MAFISSFSTGLPPTVAGGSLAGAFRKVATEGCGFLLGQVGPRPTGEVEGAAYLPHPCVASSRPLRGSRSLWSLQSVPRRGERGPLGGCFLHLHLPTDIPFLGPLHLRDFPFMWPVTLKDGQLKRRMSNRKKKKTLTTEFI